MNPIATMLIGLGVGASLMYLIDPQAGNRRRAILGDRVRRGVRKAGDAVDVTVRDLGHRAQGLAAEAQSRLIRHDVDDRVLAERVRAELGRVCSHPRSIEVAVQSGRVTLTGPILADEAERVPAWVASVPGVTDVDNRLGVTRTPDGPPASRAACHGVSASRSCRRVGLRRFGCLREWLARAWRCTAPAAGACLG
jgi:BON domain